MKGMMFCWAVILAILLASVTCLVTGSAEASGAGALGVVAAFVLFVLFSAIAKRD